MSRRKNKIEAKVIECLLDLGFDDAEMNSRTDDLGLDSLDVVELTMLVEKELGIPIPDDIASEWTSSSRVSKICEDIEAHCEKNSLLS